MKTPEVQTPEDGMKRWLVRVRVSYEECYEVGSRQEALDMAESYADPRATVEIVQVTEVKP